MWSEIFLKSRHLVIKSAGLRAPPILCNGTLTRHFLFLQPQDADVKMPNPSNSLSLDYAERRSGVDM